MAVPHGIKPGWIYHHSEFYRDQSGQFKAKFFLVLAHSTSDEIVARLLTSKPHGRRKDPPCFHGVPYPGYYLGNLSGALRAETWVDLRALDDFDGKVLTELQEASIVEPLAELPKESFLGVLDCVASAEDTTRYQESLIRDLRAKIAEA
jgi:hypothetical protein